MAELANLTPYPESVPRTSSYDSTLNGKVLDLAMRELAGLGLQAPIEAAGIENLESVFYNRFGQ